MLAVGIVLYNPDINRLKDNLDAICLQTHKVYLFNNGSKNLGAINALISNYHNIFLVNNNENVGIAMALNILINKAKNDGYKWVVTLDQDSVAPPNLVAEYLKYINTPNLGMICCKIIDRNFGEFKYDKSHAKGVEDVELCITSASAIKIDAWEQVGGFCEEMFIDSVDFDICYSLREHGYRILRTNDTFLLHEVGHSEIRNFLGKERQIFHHSPVRYYYMARNGIYLGKRHKFLKRAIYRAVRGFFLMLLFDDHKAAKARMMLLGFWHATIGRYGKL